MLVLEAAHGTELHCSHRYNKEKVLTVGRQIECQELATFAMQSLSAKEFDDPMTKRQRVTAIDRWDIQVDVQTYRYSHTHKENRITRTQLQRSLTFSG